LVISTACIAAIRRFYKGLAKKVVPVLSRSGDDIRAATARTFCGDKAPARLTRLREKVRLLAECGVDYVLCVRFDRRFAALTAQDFRQRPAG
jgi:hypothetical protein